MEIEQIAEKVNGLMANAHLHASDLYEIAYMILSTHAENKNLMPGITHMLTCKHIYIWMSSTLQLKWVLMFMSCVHSKSEKVCRFCFTAD